MKKSRGDTNISLTNVFKVYFDFETTGKSRSRIVSIGYASDDDLFEDELLVIPDISIDYGASVVHGFTRHKLEYEGARKCGDQLSMFMQRIESLNTPVIMIAHNGKSFDTHVLRHEMEIHRIPLARNIIGFLDSLWFVRAKLNVKYASIDILLDTFWKGEMRSIHSSLEDCRILKRIFNHVMSLTDDKAIYYETADEFLLRTEKWSNTNEQVKDILEEIIYKVEATCIHDSVTSTFIDVDEKKCLNKCNNCSHWFITFV